ncbi:helix-turn-helix domain-containing protein [Hymenobacter rubidus]|uniref:helix-turn-helix domain-containing protein n=1 Tax=Hymenobacter rubidus TaxID=1441626 RepID=UPI00191E550D|nr:helix-turn-helix domain-containing protein [Hymenobacter rubidus]
MDATATQHLFFQHLKSLLPPHKALVDEVADLLNISNDSAYRRIRGEKPLGLDELHRLAAHFQVSLDQLLNLSSDALLFTGRPQPYASSTLEGWLANLERQLELMNSFSPRHVYFLNKDIPLFYHFQIPELAEFKLFFWMKSILRTDELKSTKFRFGDVYDAPRRAACQRIATLYAQLPTTEIWNVETLNSALRQIDFYREAGFFATPGDAHVLYRKVNELIDNIEFQAEAGVKCVLQQPTAEPSAYRLFVNEFILGDNTFLAELAGRRLTYLNHGVLYFVGTRDEGFNDFMFAHLQNLLQKSTLISGVGEKERSRFFNALRAEVAQRLSGAGAVG